MKLISHISVIVAAISVWIFMTPFAMALPDNVRNSKHNFTGDGLSVNSTQYVGEFNEVCKYCHTPHNAGSSTLLWNKANKSGLTYRMYTSSRTLTRATVNASLTASSPSMLCLGCHDGKTAMNVLHSTSTGVDASGDGYTAGSKYIMAGGSYTGLTIQDNLGGFGIDPEGLNLGKDSAGNSTGTVNFLDDDHPIAFSYSAVYTERATGLYSLAEVATNSSNKIKFFGATNTVECTTCHNPHADADDVDVAPFLVMSNTGSAMCLSCHNK